MKYAIAKEDLDTIDSYWSGSNQNLNWSIVFMLPAWLKVWWQVFQPDAELFIRSVYQKERITGIAPLMVSENTASFIGSTDVCDYHDFVIDPGETDSFFNALLEDLKKNGIDRLDLQNVRSDSTVIGSLVPIAKSLNYAVVTSQEDVTVEMDLPGTWEEYIEVLSSKQRHEIRRKLRRLAEAGEVKYRLVDDNAEVPPAMDTFFKMFVESRSDKAHFLTEKMASFFKLLAETMAGLGLLRIGVLGLDKQALAEVMYFDYDDSIYLYNSGYDPGYESLSAGLLSKVFAVKDSIEKGKKKFDFLKGAETYKYRLGGHEVPLYRCQITIR